jgi:L-fucose mutarotase/ribose pyranase (RbsD/FucU family)
VVLFSWAGAVVVVLVVVVVLPLLPVDSPVDEVLVVEEVVLDVLEDILVETRWERGGVWLSRIS